MNKYKGDIYELHILDHLRKTEKCEFAWLWQDVPERVLFEEGIITDYAAYSLVRNDIGIDILAKKDGKYIYVQCKNYSTNSICVQDLAGYFFFKSAYGKRSRVYYNGYLSNRIKLIHPNNEEFINMPFDNQIDTLHQFAQIEEKTVYEIRDYQQEAYNSLKDKDRSILSIPCGMGKTYLSTLLAKDHDNIIFFAPTKELCSQTYGIYKKQFKDYSCNLISSDGSRQIDQYEISKKNVFVSTFKSCDIVNIIIKKLENPYIIIDEYHNLSSNDILVKKNHMHKILNSKHKILFLSATPTYLDKKNIFGETIYKYNWNDAISKGYINDFEIVLPTNDYTAIRFEEFMELFNIDRKDNMSNPTICKYVRKMFFLIRSMLFNGNKRCIVFIPTIEMAQECESIITWMKGMFNIDINAAIVDHTTTKKNRKNIISNFATESKINILLNVHVLDEGINIPQCDSVFITNPSENLGNIVQRMSRCNRVLEGKGKSTAYIWCGNTKIDKIIGYINDCTENELAKKIVQVKINQKSTFKLGKKYQANVKKEVGNVNEIIGLGRSKRQIVRPTIDKKILDMFDINDDTDQYYKEKIIGRINILGINEKKIDEYIKEIIISDTKFIDFTSLIIFMDEKKGNGIMLRDYNNKYKFSDIYAKIKEYIKIVSILKIKKGLQYNYDKDCKKFEKKVDDENIMENVSKICGLFRLTSTKYNDFNKKGGYARLYYMAISMYRHLFGEKIVISTMLSKRIKGNSVKISMYNLNELYLQRISEYIEYIA